MQQRCFILFVAIEQPVDPCALVILFHLAKGGGMQRAFTDGLGEPGSPTHKGLDTHPGKQVVPAKQKE